MGPLKNVTKWNGQFIAHVRHSVPIRTAGGFEKVRQDDAAKSDPKWGM
jgi:hypothetical protein